MIQPGNWRGHVMQVTHHKTYKKLWYRPNLPVPDRNWSAIVFTVFETFLNGQTVFRYGSKMMRITLKQCSKSGQPGGQPVVR